MDGNPTESSQTAENQPCDFCLGFGAVDPERGRLLYARNCDQDTGSVGPAYVDSSDEEVESNSSKEDAGFQDPAESEELQSPLRLDRYLYFHTDDVATLAASAAHGCALCALILSKKEGAEDESRNRILHTVPSDDLSHEERTHLLRFPFLEPRETGDLAELIKTTVTTDVATRGFIDWLDRAYSYWPVQSPDMVNQMDPRVPGYLGQISTADPKYARCLRGCVVLVGDRNFRPGFQARSPDARWLRIYFFDPGADAVMDTAVRLQLNEGMHVSFLYLQLLVWLC